MRSKVLLCSFASLLLVATGCNDASTSTEPEAPPVTTPSETRPEGDGPEAPEPKQPTTTPVQTPTPSAATGQLETVFLDVGQGDATLLKGPDFTIPIDAGRHDRGTSLLSSRRWGFPASTASWGHTPM